MTLYCNGEPCHIICGSKEEGWAAIRFKENDDGLRDVPLATLGADNPQTEIYDRIETANEEYEYDFNLRLRVTMRSETVQVTTSNGAYLLDKNLWDMEEEAENEYKFIQDVFRLFQNVQRAYEQPTLFMFRHKDKLEAE